MKKNYALLSPPLPCEIGLNALDAKITNQQRPITSKRVRQAQSCLSSEMHIKENTTF